MTYTRRDPAKTAMTYTVLKSETLASESWTGLVKDTDYQESVLSTLNDVQTVRVTLTPAPTVPKLFIRIKAD